MAQVQTVPVTPAEAGQKLMSFLRRRLGRDVPQSALMRWVRTGQVRVDGKRAKPFQRLVQGAMVRIPPHEPGAAADTPAPTSSLAGPSIIAQDSGLLVVAKPPGLPVHGGSKQGASLHSLLKARFQDAPFAPTPAHRIDKDTSGLVLVALSYERLRELQELFKRRLVRKTYLAWVAGRVEPGEQWTMRDEVSKQGAPGQERMATQGGKAALAEAAAIACLDHASLLAVRLVTGRTHQIRVQLASRSLPILGDFKYGAPKTPPTPDRRLMLHAWRIVLPDREYELAPDWPEPYAAREVRDPFE